MARKFIIKRMDVNQGNLGYVERNIYYASIESISNQIQQQELSPVEIVETCLKRIEEINPKINAFITVLADQALEKAKVAEAEIKAGKWRGPLHGVPLGVKDFYDTSGIRTTAGFENFRDRVPSKDALSVTKLKAAGAIIIGKTNMHRLGMGTTGLDSYFGPVLNPWNDEYIPGGSSSGSAAAVTSGLCYGTVDTDAIGSCRLPAACCGVVGFKGTYGLISTKGILDGTEPPDEFIVWMSHTGITTRNVEDTALMLDELADQNDEYQNTDFVLGLTRQKKVRIGIADNIKADADVRIAFERALGVFHSLGYPMRPVMFPFADLTKGLGSIELDRKMIAGKGFLEIDILLLPTTTTTVPTIEETGTNPQGLSPENTIFANYYGLPAISVPCGFDAAGLPVGLQIVGKPWEDASVLQLGYEFQNASGFGRDHPIV
jgi:aspartyl-tRNA(Asn)/glutamyl-tRNA(Gln) amidotransferase subunit A